MKTLILIILLSASVSHSKELTLDQFVTKVSNETEEAGHYELDASEVCDFFKNELNSLIRLVNQDLAARSDNTNPNNKHHESTSYYYYY